MSIRFFEGPAGTGKTTRLIEELANFVNKSTLEEHERILALTKMHGSRRRLRQRLSNDLDIQYQFECVTIDSFAWRLLQRWRSLSRSLFHEKCEINDFEEVCERAGELLSKQVVTNWITKKFPVIVIDEMQDSKGGQLKIIQKLSESAFCLAAADNFQDLDGEIPNPATSWAHEHAEVISLRKIHRTNAQGLLNAASALREGRSIPKKGRGFTLLGAFNHNVGASFVARNLTWWWNTRDIAIITPVRAENSQFVKKLIHRVEKKPIGEDEFGPFKIPWETSQETEQSRYIEQLNLPQNSSTLIKAKEIELKGVTGPSKGLKDWISRQRRIAGRTTFTVDEIMEQIRLIHHRIRAFRQVEREGVRAMTIHQAKNREFESVIVLWPYEIQGTLSRQRRLLYNAITRAKRQAIVIVQNPDRLNQPPFVTDG